MTEWVSNVCFTSCMNSHGVLVYNYCDNGVTLEPSLIIINYDLFPGLQGLYSHKVSKRRESLFSNYCYVCPSSWTEPKLLTTLLDRAKAC